MLKKIFLFLIIIAILFAWLGGIISVSTSPFSITIQKPEKDLLKKVVRKIEAIVYHEATVHNPPGDVVPDNIDDSLKEKIKQVVN
jgi:hypothetical protein